MGWKKNSITNSQGHFCLPVLLSISPEFHVCCIIFYMLNIVCFTCNKNYMYVHWQFHCMYSHLIIFSKSPLIFPEEENGVDGNICWCRIIMMSTLNKNCNWNFRKGKPTYILIKYMKNLVFWGRGSLLWASISKYWTSGIYLLT